MNSVRIIPFMAGTDTHPSQYPIAPYLLEFRLNALEGASSKLLYPRDESKKMTKQSYKCTNDTGTTIW